MATNVNITQITPPRVPIIDERTGAVSREWYRWFYNIFTITGGSLGITPVINGGTGLGTVPTNGQLLIGNGTGYSLNTLGTGAGISVTNGFGTITLANTGVLSFSSGTTGLTPATASTGNITLAGTLSAKNGGTGFATYAIGDLLYADTADTLAKLPDVATGNALISGGVNTAPAWGKIGLTTHVNGVLPIANGGTNGSATPTTYGVAYGTGTTYAFTAAGTAKQVLIANTSAAPTWTTLTSGSSILYGDGSGGFSNVTIGTGVSFVAGTLSATGSGGTVTSVTGTSPVVSSGGTTPAISLAAAYGDTLNPYASKTANYVLAAPNGSAGVPTFRALVANDIPSLSYVTSVSFTGGIITVANPTTTPALTVAGTSGGIPYFSSGTTWATSAALAANALVIGGGAGAAPATTTTGTGVVTALGVNTGTAGAFVVNGGALGTPSSGTVTNLTGTASININGTVGATTANTGAFTSLSYTTTLTGGTGIIAIGTNQFYKDASGNVGIGNTAANVNDQVGSVRPLLVSSSDTVTTIAGSKANIVIGNSNTTTSNTSQLSFAAITGANSTYFASAAINCVFGARTNGQYPTGQLVFSTSTALNSAPTEKFRIDNTGNALVTGAGGLGYGTGSGGTVTQGTSRTTGVTLNKSNGAITMFSAAGSVVAATFTVTNSVVAATDTIILSQKSGTNLYVLLVTAVAAGSFNVTFYTTGGVATDAPVINFSVIKAVTA